MILWTYTDILCQKNEEQILWWQLHPILGISPDFARYFGCEYKAKSMCAPWLNPREAKKNGSTI